MDQDPMTQVQAALASSSRPPALPRYQSPHPSTAQSHITEDPLRAARANRESTERARALALVQARRAGGETPRTDRTDGDGEGNLWNAREVREARARKEAVRGWRREVCDDWQR
jgi:hypothetical protein